MVGKDPRAVTDLLAVLAQCLGPVVLLLGRWWWWCKDAADRRHPPSCSEHILLAQDRFNDAHAFRVKDLLFRNLALQAPGFGVGPLSKEFRFVNVLLRRPMKFGAIVVVRLERLDRFAVETVEPAAFQFGGDGEIALLVDRETEIVLVHEFVLIDICLDATVFVESKVHALGWSFVDAHIIVLVPFVRSEAAFGVLLLRQELSSRPVRPGNLVHRGSSGNHDVCGMRRLSIDAGVVVALLHSFRNACSHWLHLGALEGAPAQQINEWNAANKWNKQQAWHCLASLIGWLGSTFEGMKRKKRVAITKL